MNKKPLSKMARAQMEAMGLTEAQYRAHKSEASKKASRENSYFKVLKESDPEKFLELSKKNSKK